MDNRFNCPGISAKLQKHPPIKLLMKATAGAAACSRFAVVKRAASSMFIEIIARIYKNKSSMVNKSPITRTPDIIFNPAVKTNTWNTEQISRARILPRNVYISPCGTETIRPIVPLTLSYTSHPLLNNI